jgi:hypothetical protein
LEYAPVETSRNIAGTTTPEDQRPSPEEQQQQASLQRPCSPIASDPDWQPYSPTKTTAGMHSNVDNRGRIERRRRTSATGIVDRARAVADHMGEDPDRAVGWAAAWAAGEACETWREDSDELQTFVCSNRFSRLLQI